MEGDPIDRQLTAGLLFWRLAVQRTLRDIAWRERRIDMFNDYSKAIEADRLRAERLLREIGE